MVYLRLQPYKQTIVAFKGNRKLSPRVFGPYKVFNGWDRFFNRWDKWLINWNYLLTKKSI